MFHLYALNWSTGLWFQKLRKPNTTMGLIWFQKMWKVNFSNRHTVTYLVSSIYYFCYFYKVSFSCPKLVSGMGLWFQKLWKVNNMGFIWCQKMWKVIFSNGHTVTYLVSSLLKASFLLLISVGGMDLLGNAISLLLVANR